MKVGTKKVSFTLKLLHPACTMMRNTATSCLPALPAMWQRPFSSCTLQDHLIWSSCKKLFSSDLTTVPLFSLTTSLRLKAGGSSPRSTATTTGGSLCCLISITSHTFSPPNHLLMAPFLTWRSPHQAAIISHKHAPSTSISMFFHKASSPLTCWAGGKCHLGIPLKWLPGAYCTICEVLQSSHQRVTSAELEAMAFHPPYNPIVYCGLQWAKSYVLSWSL